MKFKYIALLSLGMLAVTSCSDDDTDFNTNDDVTVELTEATIRLSEDQASSSAFNYIPVAVKGEANGPIEVTIAVSPYGEHPAVADVNYVFTTYTIIIAEGDTSASFQYYPKGDDEINDDRSFEVKIVDVKGAKIGTDDTTIVTLVDNERLIPIYYNGLAGEWNAVMMSNYDGPLPLTFDIVTVAEGEPGYGKDLTLVNFPDAGMVTAANFSVDGMEQKIYVSIPSAQSVGVLNHPTYGRGDVRIYPISGNSYTTASYNFMLEFNFDLKSGEYIVDPSYDFGVLISFSAGMMIYDSFSAMTFTR